MAEARIQTEMQKLANEEYKLKLMLKQSALSIRVLAESLEKEGKTQMVEKLGGMTEEVVEAERALTHHSQALQSVCQEYQYPGVGEGGGEHPLSDWKGMINNKVEGIRAAEEATHPFNLEEHDMVQQFKRLVWKVNHPNEPMPGREEEELVMMSETIAKNLKCPITLLDVFKLQDAVCCSDCRHIYSRQAMLQMLTQMRRTSIKCPMSGCQSKVQAGKLVSDQELQMALAELRTKHAAGTGPMGTAGGQDQECEDI